MISEASVLQQLREQGCRITEPRRAVIRVLLQHDGYLSPGEIHERARQHCPGVSLVTVYRTLELLSSMGLVRRIHSEEGCRSFARARRGHHHHLVCRRCGQAVEFEGFDLFDCLAKIGQETGFAVEDHLLELVGLCPACQ